MFFFNLEGSMFCGLENLYGVLFCIFMVVDIGKIVRLLVYSYDFKMIIFVNQFMAVVVGSRMAIVGLGCYIFRLNIGFQDDFVYI